MCDEINATGVWRRPRTACWRAVQYVYMTPRIEGRGLMTSRLTFRLIEIIAQHASNINATIAHQQQQHNICVYVLSLSSNNTCIPFISCEDPSLLQYTWFSFSSYESSACCVVHNRNKEEKRCFIILHHETVCGCSASSNNNNNNRTWLPPK